MLALSAAGVIPTPTDIWVAESAGQKAEPDMDRDKGRPGNNSAEPATQTDTKPGR